MLKNFRRTTQPTKIFLHQNFISNAFTCENLLSVFVQICFSAAAIALSAFNESFEGFLCLRWVLGSLFPSHISQYFQCTKFYPKSVSAI